MTWKRLAQALEARKDMLLLALAHPLYQYTVVNANVTAVDASGPACDGADSCRNVAGILWSCFSAVILGTWIAVHPNVPKVHDHSVVIFMKNSLIIFIAFLAPELMVLWALRQRVSCDRIAKKYKAYGWNSTHAFLVLMGGLALYDGDNFICLLWDRDSFDEYVDPEDRQFRRRGLHGLELRIAIRIEQGLGLGKITLDEPLLRYDEETAKELRGRYSCLLEYLLDTGYIHVSEEDIKDKGHTDGLLRTIAIVQTLWLIIQCCTRAARGLDVTAIEVVTLAHVALDIMMYFLWWNKPLRISCPFHILCTPRPPIRQNHDANRFENIRLRRKATTVLLDTISNLISGLSAAKTHIVEDYRLLASEKVFFFLRHPLPFAPLYPLAALLVRCRDLGAGCESDDSRYLFSSRLQHDPPQIYPIAYTSAIMFAAIHCAPWSFYFPTATEQLLWRISAISGILAPIAFFPMHLSGLHILKPMVDRAHRGSLGILVTVTITVISVVWILFISSLYMIYVVARLALIILPFTALRDLPRGAYEDVQWNESLPHIG